MCKKIVSAVMLSFLVSVLATSHVAYSRRVPARVSSQGWNIKKLIMSGACIAGVAVFSKDAVQKFRQLFSGNVDKTKKSAIYGKIAKGAAGALAMGYCAYKFLSGRNNGSDTPAPWRPWRPAPVK